MIWKGWLAGPITFSFTCFFISRRFPTTKMEIKIFLCSRISGFMYHIFKKSAQGIQQRPSIWVHKSTLNQFTLGIKILRYYSCQPPVSTLHYVGSGNPIDFFYMFNSRTTLPKRWIYMACLTIPGRGSIPQWDTKFTPTKQSGKRDTTILHKAHSNIPIFSKLR